MSNIQAKQVVKYITMPAVFPRFRRLFTSGFGYMAFLMAQIYAMVRLIPAHHPYLDPRNIGHFGLRHVIAEAANNLVISKKNTDQIVIFGLLMLAIVLLFAQIALVLISLIFGASPVLAGAFPYPEGPSIFVTGRTDDDIAFMLLDRVFGVPGFFNSCVAQVGVTCAGTTTPSGVFPWPFHIALHQLFNFYSLGMLLVGTIIFLYFVVVVVAETATTGSPFGQRFQNVWVPVRLVVAIGLLVPLPILYPGGGVAAGYNSGQYIVFAAAKYGSSMATNAWIRFNNAVAAHGDFGGGAGVNPLGERQTLVALPKQPDVAAIAEAMSMIHTCAFAYFWADEEINKGAGAGRTPLPETAGQITTYLNDNKIKPYFLKVPQAWMAANNAEGELVTNATTYQNGIDFYHRSDIVITFGIDNDTTAAGFDVNPACGQIRIPVSDQRDPSAVPYLGTVAMQEYYFDLIMELWFGPGGGGGGGGISLQQQLIDFAGRRTLLSKSKDGFDPCDIGCNPNNNRLPSCTVPAGDPACMKEAIPATWKQELINELQVLVDAEIVTIWNTYNNDGAEISYDPTLLDRGWGGAGIWFNRIAQVNGAWTVAMLNQASLDQYPLVMQEVRAIRNKHTPNVTGAEQYNPRATTDSKDEMAAALRDIDDEISAAGEEIATLMYTAYKYWHKDQLNFTNDDKTITSGAVESAMNMIFGTYGLFSMTDENSQVHPLSQLATLGKGLVEASIRNIAISTGSAALGGITRGLSSQVGAFAQAGAGFFNSVAFIGLTAGLVLYYIVPFLPFVYFYFAVASWVKTIFEAMVGTPLWALAHLRLDGEGLPGESASNGYFLIFEVFLRPLLTVFGLLAAMVIFTAQVRVLNFMWTLVTENAGGFNGNTTIAAVGGNINLQRNVVDQFFFTVVYAIVVYMMALAAFKLIDTIPDNIMRWAGASVSSFGDINQDSVDQLTRYTALGGMTAGREAAQGLQQLGGGLGGAVGGVAGRLGQGLQAGNNLKKPFG